MRNVWVAPSSYTFQGNNQPLYVQTTNTLRTGFFGSQYQLLIDHQEESAVDGGFADSTQFHYVLDSVLNVNGASLTGTLYTLDANEGVAGTANYQLARRPRLSTRRR